MTFDYRFSRLELERQEDANRIHELETEVEDLQAKVEQLRACLDRCSISCESLDHRPNEYHTGSECPVVEMIQRVRGLCACGRPADATGYCDDCLGG